MNNKNIALLIAGGSGQRMGQSIPKQFLNVDDKPIIIYTLEAFQKHPEIDAIYVVCIEGWEEVIRAYCKQFGIAKLEKVVVGGENGQSSIRNGINAIAKKYGDDDLVLIHDAIRPMVSQEIISDNIAGCKEHGSAITAIPCAEAMLQTEDKVISNSQIDRTKLMRTQTPQTFTLKRIHDAHVEALEKNITNSVASCTLLIELGQELYFADGSEKNIKLTTIDDIEIFKALLNSKKSSWMK